MRGSGRSRPGRYTPLMLPAPWLLALGLVVALLVLLPARRLQLGGFSSRVIGAYVVGLWVVAMIVVIRPIAGRFVIPILLTAYLAPFVASPERVERLLTRGHHGRGGRDRHDGPGSDGRPVKDVTPPDERVDR